MRNMFGWDLPPGCTQRQIDEAAGVGCSCDVCGNAVEDCICPECPECGCLGDPGCYEAHGLVRSQDQVNSYAAHEARMKAM
jgi:hypothetical protein